MNGRELFEKAMKHIYGDGVEEDNALAFALLTRARALGHIDATYNLGICYHYGFGTGVDLEKAFDCYMEAASAGHGKGAELVGRFYNRGIYVERDRKQAEYWLDKALNSKDREAAEEARKELEFGKPPRAHALGNRIVILGCPGSGKSTLALRLNEIAGLPLIHLDNIWWKEDGTHITGAEFDERLQAILAGEKWIIDGNYSRTQQLRIAACDTAIVLDYDTEVCLKGIRERLGKPRADLPWTEEELDPELVQMVESYRGENREKLFACIEKYPNKRVLVFSSRSETDAWLSEIKKEREESICKAIS